MRHRATALLLAALLLPAGCGRPPPDSSAVQPERQVAIQAERPLTTPPERLVIGIARDLDSLDPGRMAEADTLAVMYNIVHGLTNITPEGEIIPELCQSYEVSEDRLTYTFHLRRDARFHNGAPVRAQDVAYSYRRMMGQTEDQADPLHPELADQIEEIAVADQSTVIVRLHRPNAAFLSLCMAGVIPENSGEAMQTHPIGTGPYRFESYTPGVGISMIRFEDYYGRKPFFPAVDVQVFTGDAAGFHILKLEESVFSYDESRFELIRQPRNMVQMLAFNHEFEPFSHLEVRQAIRHAIDKQSIIDLLSPGSLRADSSLSPAMRFYHHQEERADGYPFHPQRAKDLLAQVGYADLSFTLKVPDEYQFHLDTARIIQRQLEEIGVTMEIELIEWERWLTEVYLRHSHEATLVSLAGELDPGSVMMRSVSGNPRNFYRYSSPEYDRLVTQAADEADQNRRAERYREAQAVAARDALMVPLMDPGSHLLMDRQVEGYRIYPIEYIDLRSLRWK